MGVRFVGVDASTFSARDLVEPATLSTPPRTSQRERIVHILLTNDDGIDAHTGHDPCDDRTYRQPSRHRIGSECEEDLWQSG